MRHTLTYRCPAVMTDHKLGLRMGRLYVHTFGTLTDEMTFTDEQAANRWLKCQNDGQACNEMASESYHNIPGDVT